MSVLTRTALEASPLADLHAIASELGLDGFRRLRKDDLVDAIIERQGGDVVAAGEDEAEERPRRRRGSRGGRTRRRADEEGTTDEGAGDQVVATEDEAVEEQLEEEAAERAVAEEAEPEPERRPRRRSRREREPEAEAEAAPEERGERVVEGVVELLANGSAFVRVTPPEPSDDDVYVSAAQIRRCELVAGDRVAGPVREPRRSERYPSLVRVDTINGRPVDEVAEGTHFEDLRCEWPNDRFALGSEDPTLKAIEWLTPIGRGSRATISGPSHAGKSEALKRLATALAAQDGVEVQVVLAGVRPEECQGWKDAGLEPVAALPLGSAPDAQAQAVERAVDTAKRIAARGGDVVVVVDALDALPAQAAQRILAAARNVVDGGSLTIVAASTLPVGGETTLIALDRRLTRTFRFPALDLVESGTIRPELLVGEEGAEAIAHARAQSLGA